VLAKSRFLASASHDLRQPMHALHLYLGTLAMAPMPPPTARLVAQIRQCADSMDDMFSSLLDISKLDADAMQAMQHVFAMDELLDMVQSEFTSQAARKGLSLHVRPCPALVSCDRDMLLRILRNLVSNAVRYTDKGRIMVACRRRGTDLVIGVFDTGMGIAPDQQSNVFEEFYQVKRPKLRDPAQGPGQALGQGLGLGLAIVQRLAHLMKTTVRLRSVLDKGSQFSIAVPLVSVKDRRQQARSEFSARPDLRSLVGIFVVVVDDDERVLDATRTLLEGWGCTVVAATSGHALISQLANSQRPPDAMVCDFQLEGHETGVDVISTVRDEFNQDIAALIVTGDTTPDQLSSIANTGLKILHKPLQAHLLKEALCELTHQAVAHSQA
jgi:CheY-like chemotaxis protein